MGPGLLQSSGSGHLSSVGASGVTAELQMHKEQLQRERYRRKVGQGAEKISEAACSWKRHFACLRKLGLTLRNLVFI